MRLVHCVLCAVMDEFRMGSKYEDKSFFILIDTHCSGFIYILKANTVAFVAFFLLMVYMWRIVCTLYIYIYIYYMGRRERVRLLVIRPAD